MDLLQHAGLHCVQGLGHCDGLDGFSGAQQLPCGCGHGHMHLHLHHISLPHACTCTGLSDMDRRIAWQHKALNFSCSKLSWASG